MLSPFLVKLLCVICILNMYETGSLKTALLPESPAYDSRDLRQGRVQPAYDVPPAGRSRIPAILKRPAPEIYPSGTDLPKKFYCVVFRTSSKSRTAYISWLPIYGFVFSFR